MAVSNKNEPTVEEAREVIEKHEEAINPRGLAGETDPASGIKMKAQSFDPSVLTYDPEDPEYDEAVKKRVDKERKEAEKK